MALGSHLRRSLPDVNLFSKMSFLIVISSPGCPHRNQALSFSSMSCNHTDMACPPLFELQSMHKYSMKLLCKVVRGFPWYGPKHRCRNCSPFSKRKCRCLYSCSYPSAQSISKSSGSTSRLHSFGFATAPHVLLNLISFVYPFHNVIAKTASDDSPIL